MNSAEAESEIRKRFLSLLQKPEELGVALVSGLDDQQNFVQREQLQQTCQALFRRVETLAGLYKKRIEAEEGECNLTGLDKLYIGEEQKSNGAEMLYGQIEVQNTMIQKLLKASFKALSKATESGAEIRLLDEENLSEDDRDELSGEDAVSDGDGADDDDSDEQYPSELPGDEEKARIMARMDRVMDDMDEPDDDEHEDSENVGKIKPEETDESSVDDPAANELNDGFFDINEMEAFADEEEEYLPDEAFGQVKPEKKDKRSFHQKLRDGDVDTDTDEEDDDDKDLLLSAESIVRRKKYRPDDEIDALYKLYEKTSSNNESDEEEEDVVNMTAADIFGKPKKKYLDKGNAKKKQAKPSNMSKTVKDDDDDSWNEYEFEGGERDETVEWNDEKRTKEKNRIQSDKISNEEVDDVKSDETPKNKQTIKDRKQEKLKKQIESIENEMISEKPWQMKGEVPGTARPVDSLLESTPEFQLAGKQAPIITVERTANLEEVIKKRILEEDWDDVVPRELPDVAWNKKKGEAPEVSQEKSKLGLGELYEREYLKKVAGFDADAAEKETEEDKAKNEMKTLFANLCSKLDALSNYHFTPRPIADEAEVRVVSKPALAMEEVLPLHVSDARGVAPEEVYDRKRGRDGVLRSESELDQQDRKRLRSAKKAARRKVRKEKLADEKLLSRLEPGLGLNNPYEKRKVREELSAARARGKISKGEEDGNSYGKSTTFFKRMQNEAKNAIQNQQSSEEGKGATKRESSAALKL